MSENWNAKKKRAGKVQAAITAGILSVHCISFAQSAEPNNSLSISHHVESAASRKELNTKTNVLGTFARKSINLSPVSTNEDGFFAVRIGEIGRQADIHPLLLVADQMVSSEFQKQFHLASRPQIHLDAIDYVAGVFELSTEPLKSGAAAHSDNSLRIGSPELIIHFAVPVDCKQWALQNVPKACEKHLGGITYVECLMPVLGPSPIFIAQRDSRTVIVTNSIQRLHGSLRDGTQSESRIALMSEWDRVDGGVATIVVNNKHIPPIKKATENPLEADGANIVSNVKAYAVGIEVAERGTITIKARFACADEQSANTIRDAMNHLLPEIAKQKLNPESAQSDNSFILYFKQFCSQLVYSRRTEIVGGVDWPFAIEIRSSADFPIEKLLPTVAFQSDKNVIK